MNYTYVQLITYQVPTILDTTVDVQHTLVNGSQLAFDDDYANFSDDVKGKIQRLFGAMEAAKANAAYINNSNTLKVFTVPEFYLRPADGGKHAFKKDEADLVIKYLDDKIKVDYHDWMVIPGTIIHYEENVVGLKDPNTGNAKVHDILYHNSCFQIYGGHTRNVNVANDDDNAAEKKAGEKEETDKRRKQNHISKICKTELL